MSSTEEQLQWQSQQDSAHFRSYPPLQTYYAKNPDLHGPLQCYDPAGYEYCFGDFAKLIKFPPNGSNLYDDLALLLYVYDHCKGYFRWFYDSEGISALRKSVRTKTVDALYTYKYPQYDYTQIHAHTMAAYSLSDVIMTLVSHYIASFANSAPCKMIDRSQCLIAKQNARFG